jgi:multimeric flavodoxin WrbA
VTPRLLVVWHSRSGATQGLVDALLAGAGDPEVGDVEVVAVPALTAGVDDVRAADAVLLATPANFGYMSGALKHFFDEVYDDLVAEPRPLPYALLVKGRNDVDGAVTAVTRITRGLTWREVQPPLAVVGEVTDEHRAAATELGATLAAGLALGIY